MRRVAWAAIVLGALLAVVGFACAVIAIWVVGPDSGRWAGTGALLVVAGGMTVLASAAYLDTHPVKR